MIQTILPATHNSEATAYLILDYPYGRTLRCQKRVWLETHPKKGVRLVSRTSNPKRGNDWNNAPKASTYSDVSGAMYLDENGHVQWTGLSQYSGAKESRAFLDTFGDNAHNLPRLQHWVALKEAFEEEKAKRGNPDYGTPAFVEAYKAAVQAVNAAPAA